MSKSGAETGKFSFGPGVAPSQSGSQAERDGLLHLPPQLDHLMRGLPPAYRGQLEDERAQV